LIDEPGDWKNKLLDGQYVLNNTFHKAINSTPSKLLLGYDQRNHTDYDLQLAIKSLQDIDQNLVGQRLAFRDNAQKVNRKLQLYNKEIYDEKHKKPTLYKEGDLVMIRDMAARPGINKKLLPKFKGPYQVRRVLRKNRYVIGDVHGGQIANKPYNSVLSSDKLKPWIRVTTHRSED